MTMGKVLGLRQQRVQFFYDTDFKAVGVTTTTDIAASEKILFANASPGDLSRTNMQAPGQLISDQTFLCFSVRHELQFYGVAGVGVATSGFTTTAEMGIWVLHNSTFQFKVSEKVEFEGPLAMTPAGGGPWGYVNDSAQPLITNGHPATPSIYVLPLPVAVTKRQGIQMIEKKFTFAQPSGTAIDVVAAINSYTGGKMLRAYIDGYNTRDVL